MPTADPIQLVFTDGLNAQAAPDKVGEAETPYALNIDFSAEWGAARVRRGSARYGTVGGSAPITQIFRNYNNPSDIGASPFYVVATDAVYRGSANSWTSIYGTSLGDVIALGTFNNYALIGGADADLVMLKDDGTNTTHWIKQAPASVPTLSSIVYSTQNILATFVVTEDGTAAGTDTTTGIGTSGTAGGTVQFSGPPTSTNLAEIGGVTIGDYGVNFLSISFSDPSVVSRVTQDYSIGNTDFTDYFHYSVDMLNGIGGEDVKPDVETLMSRISVNPDNSSISRSQRADLNNIFSNRRSQEVQMAEAANVTLSRWGVARPKYQLIGQLTSTSGADPWADIQAVRLIVETTGICTVTLINWFVQGDEQHSLNDSGVGINYWVTYAQYDADGVLIDQSAPSAPLTDIRVSYGQPIVKHVGTATGSHGITHRILYRAGGYLPDAYAVSTATYAAGTATFTDTLSDLSALIANYPMPTALYSKDTFDITPAAVVEHKGRVFTIGGNKLRYSLPDQPGTFPVNSGITIGPVGDDGQALFSYGSSLVIVCRDSVYELRGNVFEGAEQDWVLQRTASRHGSKAARTCINTPVGILLLDYDGITFYQPGQGVDVDIKWIADKIGDVWRGDAATDPAILKGLRVQGLSRSYIRTSAAAYVDNKLYLALPCSQSTSPNLIFVIDFGSKRVWYYDYPFATFSLYWDFLDNKLLNGQFTYIEQLESGVTDIYGTTTAAIPYSIRSRTWTTNNDFRVENLSFEAMGTHTAKVFYDNTNTTTIGTFTNTAIDWVIPALNGGVANNIAFQLDGSATTGNAVVNAVTFNAIMEPPQVRYFRTEYDDNQHSGENLWEVHNASLDIIGTGTITAVSFIDGAAVATFTNLVGPTNGRKTFHNSYPAQTYGNVAFTTYTSTADALRIKHWGSWNNAKKEPAPINTLRTEYVSMDENICDAHDVDIHPNGTVTATVYVDNAAVGTYSYTGTARQSFVSALPSETYGRTIYAVYNGSGFKHYNTWWDLRPEPDRMTNYVATRESKDEEIVHSVNWDVNCLGATLTGIVYVDGTAVSTHTATGTLRQSHVFALPNETYGRTKWVAYSASGGGGKFKHYNTWFDTTPEPDRLTNYVVTRESKDEEWVRNANWDIDCLGGTVLSTWYVDGSAVATKTFSGSLRQSYVDSLPDETMGRTKWVVYNATGTGKFKHYNTWWDTTPEPDRVSVWHERIPYSSENYIKTWVAEINPLGTTVGTLSLDGTSVWTNTFVGTRHQVFDIGVDVAAFTVQSTGTVLDILYTAELGQRLKHYNTQVEAQPKPFGKKTWQIVYTKLGGVSRVDTARSFSMDVEGSGTSTLTSVWYVDGRAYNTNTLTFTGRQWREWIPLPPDGRGYLFRQEIKSTHDIRVWHSSLDMLREGVKGCARVTVKGTPT